MEYDEKIFSKYFLMYICSPFLISFINSSRNSNGDFFVFSFDASGSGSSSAAIF